MQEVDCETVVHSKYVADSAKQVLNEAGDITIPIEKGLISSAHVIAEIGQVIAGHKVKANYQHIEISIELDLNNNPGAIGGHG